MLIVGCFCQISTQKQAEQLSAKTHQTRIESSFGIVPHKSTRQARTANEGVLLPTT
jgi:hypothetical protein